MDKLVESSPPPPRPLLSRQKKHPSVDPDFEIDRDALLLFAFAELTRIGGFLQ